MVNAGFMAYCLEIVQETTADGGSWNLGVGDGESPEGSMFTLAQSVLTSHMHSTDHITHGYDTRSYNSIQQSTHESG